MIALSKLLHIAAAIVWLGGMSFLLLAFRPVAVAQLAPPQRLPLMAGVLERFFRLVWAAIALLLVTGAGMLMAVGMKAAPLGWHLMLGLGVLMVLIYAHIYFAPFKRLQRAVAAADWPAGGRAMASMQPLVLLNFALGWLAIVAVLLLH